MNQDTAVIVNLTEQSWILHRSYGVFAVNACVPGEPYGITRVTSRTAMMDLGDKRTMDVRITAREVAQDLCHRSIPMAATTVSSAPLSLKATRPPSGNWRKSARSSRRFTGAW